MSWQDRDKLDLKITTGDGREHIVFWLTAQLKIRWHGGDQSYIELPDSKVEKRKRQGRSFPMEFFFEGDDHLDKAAAFRSSLDDPNPCTIEHPYYNTIVAQILELDIDNSQLNVSRCTCLALETMVGYSAVISNPKDTVLLKKVELDALLEEQPEIKANVQEINTLKDTTAKIQKRGVSIISIPEQAQEYFNAFSTASSYISTFTATPIFAMQALNNFLTLPSKFISGVEDRVEVLKEQFDILRTTINGVLRPPAKQLYFAQQTGLVSTLCQAAVLPLPTDYIKATAALRISDIIMATFQQLQEDMDTLQTDNNGSPDSFIPDFNLYRQLEDLVMATTAGLYQIALNGRRLRTFDLTEDSNIIQLTHLLLRLDAEDRNLQEFIDTNNITYKEIALGLEKGRRVVYYI